MTFALRLILYKKYLNSVMVARLKLKGIDGKIHKSWILRLNLIQHGKTYAGKKLKGLTA